MSAKRRGGRARTGKPGVGRRIALAALILIVGLVLGAASGLKLADQPVVRRVLNKPETRQPAKTDTIEKETTPASCTTAIETLADALAGLAGARQRLMQGDVARASGDQKAAGRAYAEVDAALRDVEVATTNDPLRAAIDDCKRKTPPAATPSPPGTAPGTPTQTAPPSPPSR